MILETERLILREYTWDDFDGLYALLSDPETMCHYPKPYDEAGTRRWIQWNLDNYQKYGFGLWALVLKETGAFIGDCGITMQSIDAQELPEVGYHIHRNYWCRGYGSEAARAARDWAFENRDFDALYSYMKYTNIASYSTAAANGMRKIKEYQDPEDGILYVYAIPGRSGKRGEFHHEKNALWHRPAPEWDDRLRGLGHRRHADRPAGGEVYRSGVLFSPGLGWTAGLRCDRRGGVCDIHGGVPEKGLECI